jgi:hypothetical protein
MGRDPFRRGFDAERQWLHSHAERGNDQLSSGAAESGNDQRSGRDAGRGNDDLLIIRHTKKKGHHLWQPFLLKRCEQDSNQSQLNAPPV